MEKSRLELVRTYAQLKISDLSALKEAVKQSCTSYINKVVNMAEKGYITLDEAMFMIQKV